MPPRALFALLLLVPALLGAQDTTATPAAPAAAGPPSMITGVVFDSLSGQPLRGAVVQVVPYPDPSNNSFAAITDSVGRYRIEGVTAGRYVAGFFHASLDSLELQAPMRVADIVAGDTVRLDLAIPGPRALREMLCPVRAPGAGDDTGMLIGTVYDADSGAPLANAVVVAIWTDLVIRDGLRQQRRQLPAKTTETGMYRMCGVPADVELVARAEYAADSSGFITVMVPPGGALRRDFGIGLTDSVVAAAPDSAAAGAEVVLRRGNARVTGAVRDVRGRPVKGASVIVWGTGVEGTTSETGSFALGGLPSGTHSLEVRRLGFAPTRVTVDLARGRPHEVDVVLGEAVPVLEAVTVYGKQPRRSSLSGFLERRARGGFGRFLTREDIEKRGALYTSDAFRMVPGVRVVPTSGFGYALQMRGGCSPVVYLDGMRMYMGEGDSIDNFVNPQQIAGIEVYNGTAGAPPQYMGNGCGSVVIWTGGEIR